MNDHRKILRNRDLFHVEGPSMIEFHCEITEIKRFVDRNEYHAINEYDAVKNLSQVGQLLILAYSGSEGYDCNGHIFKAVTRYKEILNDIDTKSSANVVAILKALDYMKISIVLAEGDKIEKALQILPRCSESAHQLHRSADEMIDMVKDLCKLTEEALHKASRNRATNRKMHELKKERSEQEKIIEELHKGIQKERVEAMENYTDANLREVHGLMLCVIPLLSAVKLYLPLDSAGAKENAEHVASLRRKYQGDVLKQNIALIDTVAVLGNTSNSGKSSNLLEKSIVALEIALELQGKILANLYNSKLYWEAVTKQSDKVASLYHKKSSTFRKDVFIQNVKVSAFCMLALCRIYRRAAVLVRKSADSEEVKLTRLFNRPETEKLSVHLSARIMAEIVKENKAITNSMEKK